MPVVSPVATDRISIVLHLCNAIFSIVCNLNCVAPYIWIVPEFVGVAKQYACILVRVFWIGLDGKINIIFSSVAYI